MIRHIKFYHQLSFRQARTAVLAGFFIGMIVSLIQISSDLLKERKQFDSTISQVVSMVRDSAAQAVYDIDDIQAEKVVNGLFKYKPLYDAKIIDDEGSLLASVSRPLATGRLDWLVAITFGQENIYEENLFFGVNKVAAGRIRVKVDSYIIAVNFIDRAIMIIIGGIVRNLILACIFTVLFYYTLTRPLLRMVKSVSLVDPDNPADTRVEHSQGHKNDEMGLLVRTINRLLKGFDDSLTRQRKAERKVSEREAFIRGIMDNVPDGILTVSEKGLIESCNSSAENLFGYRADELTGFSPDQLINEPERSLLYDIIDSYLKSGDSEKLKQAPGEASALCRNSASFPLEIRLNEMHLRERCIIICVLSDISERKQNEELKAENLRMSTELDVTRRLQQMILPTPDELQQIEGLDIVGYMKPAAEVGGDYYDVLRYNGSVKIGIGDVTGHGLESGVLMLMTQTAVRTLLTSGEKDPARFLDILNRTLYDNVRRMKADKSLTLALLDYKEGQLRLSGQHEYMIVVRNGGKVELVDTIDLGFPIALDDNIVNFVDEVTVTLGTGDGIVLYTDGITEAENAAGEFYGLKRLCSVISLAWEGSTTEEVKQAVIDDVKEYIGKQDVFDDLTLVVLKQK